MPKFVVGPPVGTAPAAFRPLADRHLTDVLRGRRVTTSTGHLGEIRHAYEIPGACRVFVDLHTATGWFDLADLTFDQEQT